MDKLFPLAIGLLVPVFFHQLPSLLLLLTLFCACALLAIKSRHPFHRVAFIGMSSLLFGIFLSSGHLQIILAKQLPERCDRLDQQADIKITRLLSSDKRVTRFDAVVLAISGTEVTKVCEELSSDWLVNKKIKVAWYHSGFDETLDTRELAEGQNWQVTLRFKRPRGLVNPGGFDYQAWLLSQGFNASAYVKNNQPQSLLKDDGISNFQQYRNSISGFLNQSENQRFFKALVLGDKSEISSQDWAILQATGVIHLMAISGLHVGFVAWLSFQFFQLLLRGTCRYSSAQNGLIIRIVPSLAAILSALAYAALAGFSIPTQRAFIAVLLLGVCHILGLRFKLFSMVLLGVCIVLVLNPFAPLSSGFWLSFLAVMALIVALQGSQSNESAMKTLLKVQWVLALALLLPLLALGQAVSLLAPLANLVAVPVVTFLIVPPLLLACFLAPYLSLDYLLFAVDKLFTMLWYLLSSSAMLLDQYALWRPEIELSLPLAFVLAFLTILFLSPQKMISKALPLVLIVLVLLGSKPRQSGDLDLQILDVGQGLAIVMHHQGQHMVYDTGAHFSPSFNSGERLLAPYLHSRAVREIDLVVSHNDNDHAGGAEALSKAFKIRKLFFGEQPEKALAEDGQYCYAGQSWRYSDVQLEVLWPKNLASAKKLSGNNSSCVLLLRKGEIKILLMGDVEKQVEQQILDEGSLPTEIDLLIAPHHGSSTSSTQALVDHLQAKYVVFSAGYKNSYHHPNAKIVRRYENAGAEVLNTATDGAINFVWREGAVVPEVTKERIRSHKPWFSGVDKNYRN